MTIYDKLSQTMADRDVNAYLKLVHENVVFVFHKTGNECSKNDWAGMVTGMMTNDKFIQDSTRCVYENADILVEHAFMSYPDDTKEAATMVAMLKDGNVIRIETGATPLN